LRPNSVQCRVPPPPRPLVTISTTRTLRRRGDDPSDPTTLPPPSRSTASGLGVRADEALPGDARGWLLAQFDSYVAQPQAWSEQPSSAALLVAYGDLVSRPAPGRRGERGRARQKLAAEVRDRYRAAVGARIATALVTPAPFAERLVHFWANHFAVSIEKPSIGSIAGAFEAEAIRTHVFGSFETLLLAVERHPAMLIYLDQVRSIGPAERRRAGAPPRPTPSAGAASTRNLAREILELHTTGVRSGYSQDDVTELARALTGWSVGATAVPVRRAVRPASRADSCSSRRCTSRAFRSVLGERYEPSGEGQALAILRRLAVAPGDGAPHRDQARAPLRRRCAGAGARRSARERIPAQRRRPADGLSRPDRFARGVAGPKRRSSRRRGNGRCRRCAASAGATCAAGARADDRPARPADVAAGIAGRLRRQRGELGRSRRADASRRAGAAFRRAAPAARSTRARSARSCCPAACRRRRRRRSLAPTARRPRSRCCSRRPNS
jgi:hypothetical protein